MSESKILSREYGHPAWFDYIQIGEVQTLGSSEPPRYFVRFGPINRCVAKPKEESAKRLLIGIKNWLWMFIEKETTALRAEVAEWKENYERSQERHAEVSGLFDESSKALDAANTRIAALEALVGEDKLHLFQRLKNEEARANNRETAGCKSCRAEVDSLRRERDDALQVVRESGSLRARAYAERDAAKETLGRTVSVTTGTSCLTRDLVWCACGRGISRSGNWNHCPQCGGKIDQESYRRACAEAIANGGHIFHYVSGDGADKIRKLEAERDAAIEAGKAAYGEITRVLDDAGSFNRFHLVRAKEILFRMQAAQVEKPASVLKPLNITEENPRGLSDAAVRSCLDNDHCPYCAAGELDTGYECNKCGADCLPIRERLS